MVSASRLVITQAGVWRRIHSHVHIFKSLKVQESYRCVVSALNLGNMGILEFTGGQTQAPGSLTSGSQGSWSCCELQCVATRVLKIIKTI